MVKVKRGTYLPTSFAKPSKQAGKIAKKLQRARKKSGDKSIKSLGSKRNYEQALTSIAKKIQLQTGAALRDLGVDDAVDYLIDRSAEVHQSTLDLERQAIEKMMLLVTFKLNSRQKLPIIQSELKQILKSRRYTREQIHLIINHQRMQHALSSQIAYQAGLRAHELLTIRPIHQQRPDARPSLKMKFDGRPGIKYTVVGKGGLTREINIPHNLSLLLESLKFDTPRKITDRNIYYDQYYDIGGGQKWSSSFSSACKRALGWSNGAHGLRHTYVQERMTELGILGHKREIGLKIVSQEIGHFRPSIIEIYLR